MRNRWAITGGLSIALTIGFESRDAAGQTGPEWHIGVGPAVAATRPRLPFDPSVGGIVRAVYFPKEHSNGFSLGIDMRAAYMPWRIGRGQICTETCFDVVHPRVLAVAGAGVASQLSRSFGGGTSAHVRGFAGPALAVAAVNDDTGVEASISPSAGVALGVARGRLHVDFEVEALPNTQGKAPFLWSLQGVFTR